MARSKQYVRIYRGIDGEVRHIQEQDTPIKHHVSEWDRDGRPVTMTYEDMEIINHPMQVKHRARALLEIFRTAENDEEIRARIPGEITSHSQPRRVMPRG